MSHSLSLLNDNSVSTVFAIVVDGIHITAQPDKSLFCRFGEPGQQRTVEVMFEVCICLYLFDIINAPSSSRNATI